MAEATSGKVGGNARLRLEVVTPNGVVFRDEVDYVEAPGEEGYFGVLPGHAPFLSGIKAGRLEYRRGEETHELAVDWGYVEVLNDHVMVLAETAERGDDIDLERAESARRRARERLAEFGASYDVERAQMALARAEARVEAASVEMKNRKQS